MPKCRTCGRKVGLFYFLNDGAVCMDCREKTKNETIENRKRESIEDRQRKEESIQATIEDVQTSVQKGKARFLYNFVFLSVDSVLLKKSFCQGFEIHELQRMGLDGWEVIGIVPKTVGVGLENVSIGSTSGQTYGGGIGGNVAGVYVLLKKVIHSEEDLLENNLEEYVRPLFDI